MDVEKENLGALPFVVSGLSFIPLLGVVFGIISIIWGIVTKKKRGKFLVIIGSGGIMTTVVICLALSYFGFIKRGGIYDGLRSDLTKTTITSLMQAIEFYKVQNENYPVSLEALRESLPKRSMIVIYDTTDIKFIGKPRLFHYELVDSEHYYLLGVGPDGKPFTRDDILPEVNIRPGSKIGFLIKSNRDL